jgi:hypothetical protein
MSCSAADVVHFDATLAGYRVGLFHAAQFGIAIVSPLPDVADGGCDLIVAEAAAQQGAKVVAVRGEET